MAKKLNGKREDTRNGKRNGVLVYALLLTVAFSFRVGNQGVGDEVAAGDCSDGSTRDGSGRSGEVCR